MRVCPSCSEQNPDRARFCGSCGTPLPELGQHDAERKPVTVLYCDLVGFTVRSDRADPEDVKATLRPFHARIAREIENHGGTLDKFIGDAVLGVFGAPVNHEDDPERALRAAFRILDAIEEMNDERAELGLAARIGIDTGEAMVAVGPGPQVGERVTGDVVSRAGLLQAAAPVNGIAIGETTHRATRDLFAFEELPPVDVPGLRRTVPAWRPMAVSRLVRERPQTPFVGREEESAMLRAAYRRAVGMPALQLVTITGEPGIGKSRLLQEFAEHLDRERDIIRWRLGRCRPYGEGVTFAPLGDIVKTEAGILDSDPAEDVRRKLKRAIDIIAEDPGERDWLTARLRPLVGIGDPAAADRAESFTAWRRTLEAMAAQHPTIVVLEDLHWADPAFLDFVDHVVDHTIGLPLLVLCAARPSLFKGRPEWGGGKRNATAISLRPLSETETSMLVSALLDPAALPAETRATVLDRAGGNPLYAEEFAWMLGERDDLDDGEIAVPETVQALIAARLDTLAPDVKSLIQDAAVLGRVFWSGAVAEMAGRPTSEVDVRLNDLARQEMIRPIRASAIAGEAEFTFWHLLVRDVAYEQIPRSERGAKHRAAAEWLARVAGERMADRAETLAHHYGTAVELAGEAVDDDLRGKAARSLALAADRVRRLDAEAADRMLTRARTLLPPRHPERGPVLVRAGEIAATLGRFAESRRDFEEAIEGYRDAGDTLALGEAMARHSRSLFRLGDARRAEQLLADAVEMLEREPPGPQLARAAGNALIVGRWEECVGMATRALEISERLDLPEETVRARQALGAARCEMGDEGGLADLWAALRQGVALGLGEETVVTYGNLAYQLWLRDGPTIALQASTSALEFAEVRGFITESMWTRAGQLEALFDLGRWDEVLEIALGMEAWDREEGGGQIRTFAEIYRGMVLAYRGAVQEATLLAEVFLPRVRIVHRVEFLAPALVVGATNELARGHDAMAVALVDEFLVGAVDHAGFRAQHLPQALRVLVAAGASREDLLPTRPPANTRDRNSRATAQADRCGGSRRPRGRAREVRGGRRGMARVRLGARARTGAARRGPVCLTARRPRRRGGAVLRCAPVVRTGRRRADARRDRRGARDELTPAVRAICGRLAG